MQTCTKHATVCKIQYILEIMEKLLVCSVTDLEKLKIEYSYNRRGTKISIILNVI